MDPEQLVANQRRVSRGRDGGLIACNLDAYAKGAGEPVEAKSCADYRIRDEWGAAGSDEVPFGYMIQVQTEILVCGPKCQRGHLFAVLGWRSDMMPVWYILKRHDGLIRLIEDAAMWFWKEHVEPGVPPKGGEIPPEALLRAIRPDAGKTAELGDDMLAVANALETHKELRLLHEKGEKACELELRNALRDASVGLLPDGRRAEIKTVKRKGYTVEETEYTQFAIKTPKASKGEE